MEQFTLIMFLLCLGTFLLTLLINKIKETDGVMLNILSLMVCIFAIATSMTDTDLMLNVKSQGDLVLLMEVLIGIMHIPKLYYAVGVDRS